MGKSPYNIPIGLFLVFPTHSLCRRYAVRKQPIPLLRSHIRTFFPVSAQNIPSHDFSPVILMLLPLNKFIPSAPYNLLDIERALLYSTIPFTSAVLYWAFFRIQRQMKFESCLHKLLVKQERFFFKP